MPPKTKGRPQTAAASSAPPPSGPSIAEQQILPQKEQGLFKQIVRFYESKQYKKALRSADTVLKRFPHHGETLAMKGLVYSQMKKFSEAYDFVKKGLAANLKSHVCWHVYGLIYRTDRKYKDAIKCFEQAIKRDPQNQMILKDLSLLQIQMRELTGYISTRKTMLLQKANQKNNWIGYAVALHLAGQHKKALEIIDKYEETLGEEDRKKALEEKREKGEIVSEGDPVDYEDSELKLYKLQIFLDMKDYEKAWKYIEEINGKVSDIQFYHEKKGECLLMMNRLAEAESLYMELLKMNSEQYHYHAMYRKCKGLNEWYENNKDNDEKTADSLIDLYRHLQTLFPKSNASKRIPLDFIPASHNKFQSTISDYMMIALRKGIPNLFSDLRPLYAHKGKADAIEGLLVDYLNNLRTELKFVKDQSTKESPVALLWTLYYAGHHFLYRGQVKKALELVDEAIHHTPTAIDLYKLKAKIYKDSGDYLSAYHYMDTARRMDTQDRYLNTKCVRYAWRAGKIKEAEETLCLFFRDADKTNPVKHVADLQVMWYELSAGGCYHREKRYALALKRYLSIDKHFDDFLEDQFDFHNYCLRKVTLRAYYDMIKWADCIRSHRFFVRAARAIVSIYLSLFDEKNMPKNEQKEDAMTEEEKKKEAKRLKHQAKKDKKKAEKAVEDGVAKTSGESVDKDDADPTGEEYLKRDPLKEATIFVNALQTHSPSLIHSHTLAIQLYSRKQKPLLVAKAIHAGYALQSDDPEYHLARLSFIDKLDKEIITNASINPLVKTILTEERKTDAFGNGKSSNALNDEFLQKHSNSFSHRFAAARVLYTIDKSAKAKAIQLIANVACEVDLESALSVLDWLINIGADESAIASYKSSALQRFPLTIQFGATAPTILEEKDDDTTNAL